MLFTRLCSSMKLCFQKVFNEKPMPISVYGVASQARDNVMAMDLYLHTIIMSASSVEEPNGTDSHKLATRKSQTDRATI